MKAGELVYLPMAELLCRVTFSNEKSLILHVINGNYDFHIKRVILPKNIDYLDYSKAIGWIKERLEDPYNPKSLEDPEISSEQERLDKIQALLKPGERIATEKDEEEDIPY